MSEPEDPARRFLDQTVPRHDEWDGREPEEGPARPRHVQHPTEPVEPMSAKERRSAAIRRAAWVAGGVGAFAAGAALSDDDPEPQAADVDAGFGEAGSGF
jgi:hypothetical protein